MWWSVLVVSALLISGCATTPEAGSPTIDDGVSPEGQRFLTFCASPSAAERAKRHHAIERGSDEDKRAENLVPLPVEGAEVRGDRDAAITIHLFTDLRCSECRAIYQRLVTEVDTRPGEARLVVRHMPRDERGQSVARAAIAAGEQGRFFDFVDALYEEGRAGSEQDWERAAEQVGLDVERWQRDRRMSINDAILESDALHAEDVDVVDAPTFFINGVRMVGAEAITEFDEVFNQEKAHVEAMEEAGLAGAQISWRRVLENYRPVDWERVAAAEAQLEEGLQIDYVPVGQAPTVGAPAEDALVTVVIFADFLCPYSAEAAELWAELIARHGDDGLRIAFRHFPLPIHEGSAEVAAAAVMAHQIGRFWAFHDAFFGGEIGPEMGELAQALRNLGWSGDGFAAALQSEQVHRVVDGDRKLAEEVGVEGTPTIFVNGLQLMGVWSVDELEPLILDQLELAQAIADVTGNTGDELYLDLVEINRGW